MAEATLTGMRVRAGVWEGILTGAKGTPVLQVELQGRVLDGLTLTEVPDRRGNWAVRVPIPAEVLSDGVQTFLIRAQGRDEVLARFTIVTGVALEDDLRAEIDLLRAELDLLKRAFRRHCLETAGQGGDAA
jgi:hypothetical protein